MSETHRLPHHIVTKIESAISSAKLTCASFDTLTSPKEVTLKHGEVTDFIRERVKLHHDTWIVGALESVLEWSKTIDDGSQKEWDILGRLRAPLPNPVVLEQAHEEISKLRDETLSFAIFKNTVTKSLKDVNDE